MKQDPSGGGEGGSGKAPSVSERPVYGEQVRDNEPLAPLKYSPLTFCEHVLQVVFLH